MVSTFRDLGTLSGDQSTPGPRLPCLLHGDAVQIAGAPHVLLETAPEEDRAAPLVYRDLVAALPGAVTHTDVVHLLQLPRHHPRWHVSLHLRVSGRQISRVLRRHAKMDCHCPCCHKHHQGFSPLFSFSFASSAQPPFPCQSNTGEWRRRRRWSSPGASVPSATTPQRKPWFWSAIISSVMTVSPSGSSGKRTVQFAERKSRAARGSSSAETAPPSSPPRHTSSGIPHIPSAWEGKEDLTL